MEPEGGERSLSHLDGLRGVAAVVVALHHFACAFLPRAVFGPGVPAHFGLEQIIWLTPLQLAVAGNFAVCIFFALSGYVLSHKFFVTSDVRQAQSGAVRRYVRLTGPILVAVLLGWAVYRLGWTHHVAAAEISGSSQWLARLWPGDPSFIEALKQGAYGAILGRSDTTLFNNVLWTMKTEFFGSMLVFAFLALAGNLRWRWVLYVLGAVIFAKSYYLAFVLGVALCDTDVRRRVPAKAWIVALGGAWGLLLGGLPLAGPAHPLYHLLRLPGLSIEQEFIFWHVIGAVLVLIAVTRLGWLRRGLGSKLGRALGRVSFALYLVHVPLIGSLAAGIVVAMTQAGSNYLGALVAAFAAWAVVCAVGALAGARWVDQPSVRASRWVWRRWFAPSRSKSPRPA